MPAETATTPPDDASSSVSRWQQWLEETHGAQFELLRHFTRELFSSELIASPEYLRRWIFGLLGLLTAFGLVLPRVYFKKYAYLSQLPTPDLYLTALGADRLFFISLSMTVGAFVAAFEWNALFPARRDYLILRPLPVALRQIFFARLLSVVMLAVLFVLALNVVLAFTFPSVSAGRWLQPPLGIPDTAAQGFVTISAGVSSFLALVALQGLLINLAPPRVFEHISLALQITVVIALLCAVPWVFQLPNVRLASVSPQIKSFAPAIWFLDLQAYLLGVRSPETNLLAQRAIYFCMGSLALVAITYFFAYQRQARRALEAQSSISVRWSERLAEAALRLMFRSQRSRGSAIFIWKTLVRSRQQKLLLAIYAGAGIALVLTSAVAELLHGATAHGFARRELLAGMLSVPLALIFFLVFGLRYVFQIPAEVRANWIFQLRASTRRNELTGPATGFILLIGVLPAVLITLPLEAHVIGWALACAHALLCFALGTALTEIAMRDWHKLPFTCSFLPGRRNIIESASLGVLGLFLFTTILSMIEVGGLLRVSRLLIASVVVLAIAAVLNIRRRRSTRDLIEFDDAEITDVEPLHLLAR